MDAVDREITLGCARVLVRLAVRLQAIINEPEPAESMTAVVMVLEGQLGVLRELTETLVRDALDRQQKDAADVLASEGIGHGG